MDYFTQDPPEIQSEFQTGQTLDLYLRRLIPQSQYGSVRDLLESMDEISTGELWNLLQKTRGREPKLTPWDPWGNRIDNIEEEPLWKRARTISLDFGLSSLPYEASYGRYSRVVQMALVCLFHPSSGFFTCPLAMTDGAARTLIESKNKELIEKVVPRLSTDEPEQFWLSGQWMTETPGGSDLRRSETEARKENSTWKLYGKKWFTSAVQSSMALVLARPEDQEDLALFYVNLEENRRPGKNMTIDRLKDKLGTRRLPTAEVTLDGLPATPVDGTSGGIKAIAPMLNRTRLWNSACAVGTLRRGLNLLKNYAEKRETFGEALIKKPMFQEVVRKLETECKSGLLLTLHVARIMGRIESDDAHEQDSLLLRMLTPLAKISTARQSVHGISEIIEGFGGAGYIEDTGLPRMLRDAQVFPIWEGPTNVLILEFLNTCLKRDGWRVIREDLRRREQHLRDAGMDQLCTELSKRIQKVEALFEQCDGDRARLETNGRPIAFTTTRAYHLALLGEQTLWNKNQGMEGSSQSAATRLCEENSSFFP